MFSICYIILSTNMEWKEYSLLHKLYIQGKKEQIYNTDLALPEFFLDQEKAISQLANTMFRKVIHDLKKLKKAKFKWREMCEHVVKQWTRGKKTENWEDSSIQFCQEMLLPKILSFTVHSWLLFLSTTQLLTVFKVKFEK